MRKTVAGFPNYEVSECGEVYNRQTGRRLIPGDSNDGYLHVCLNINGNGITKWVHRLVAKAFVENPRPDIFCQVDHIDRNEKNNQTYNLRWLTRQLNMLNSSAEGCTFNKIRKRWVARLRKNGRQINLGSFKTFLEGHRVYRARREELFNEIYKKHIDEGPQAFEFLP